MWEVSKHKKCMDGGRQEHKRPDREHMHNNKKNKPSSHQETYLHGLDGLVGVLHGADLIVDRLVRQQQLVEDLQGPGPVADRFQRHDRRNEGRSVREGEEEEEEEGVRRMDRWG